jgi:hypothetical protein
MSEQLRFVPPRVDFDPTLANELARYPAPAPAVADELYPIRGRRSPFKDYVRMLTPEGGILILYKDQDRGWFLMVLRVFAWIMATGVGGWLIFFVSALSVQQSVFAVALLMLVAWLIVRQTVEASHSLEIRPNAMIIDSADVFYGGYRRQLASAANQGR